MLHGSRIRPPVSPLPAPGGRVTSRSGHEISRSTASRSASSQWPCTSTSASIKGLAHRTGSRRACAGGACFSSAASSPRRVGSRPTLALPAARKRPFARRRAGWNSGSSAGHSGQPVSSFSRSHRQCFLDPRSAAPAFRLGSVQPLGDDALEAALRGGREQRSPWPTRCRGASSAGSSSSSPFAFEALALARRLKTRQHREIVRRCQGPMESSCATAGSVTGPLRADSQTR